MEGLFTAGLVVWLATELLVVAGMALMLVLAPLVVPLLSLGFVFYSCLHDE